MDVLAETYLNLHSYNLLQNWSVKKRKKTQLSMRDVPYRKQTEYARKECRYQLFNWHNIF